MNGVDQLRGHGRMTWVEAEQGWVAVPEAIVGALARDGFEECKRAMTTSRRDGRPAGGVWQGINPGTGAVASAIWVNRLAWPQATIFITVDGEPLEGHVSGPAPDPPRDDREDGGEG